MYLDDIKAKMNFGITVRSPPMVVDHPPMVVDQLTSHYYRPSPNISGNKILKVTKTIKLTEKIPDRWDELYQQGFILFYASGIDYNDIKQTVLTEQHPEKSVINSITEKDLKELKTRIKSIKDFSSFNYDTHYKVDLIKTSEMTEEQKFDIVSELSIINMKM